MTATLTFVVSPPGFTPLVDFVLDEVAGAHGLFTLRPAAVSAPRLYVLDAGVYLPAYTPELSDQQVASLGLSSPDDALVLVVANPRDDGTTTTNLMAPIVVNSVTGACAQFILDNQDWPLKAELARA